MSIIPPENANCSGAGPHEPGEVRRMSIGGGGRISLCRSCWQKELEWRRKQNKSLALGLFDLPDWDKGEVYAGE